MQANLSAVRARRATIARQLQELSEEDTELASVEGVLMRLSGRAAEGAPKRRGRKPRLAATARAGRKIKTKPAKKAGRGRRSDAGSQRELVLATLKKPGAGWMDIKQIIASVKTSHGVSIPPRSLSPLLSNLKKTGVIVRQGRRVAAPERARAR